MKQIIASLVIASALSLPSWSEEPKVELIFACSPWLEINFGASGNQAEVQSQEYEYPFYLMKLKDGSYNIDDENYEFLMEAKSGQYILADGNRTLILNEHFVHGGNRNYLNLLEVGKNSLTAKRSTCTEPIALQH